MVKTARTGFFFGEYSYQLDEKRRMALPKRIRVEIDGFEIVIMPGFEKCIAGFDKNIWQKMAQEQLKIPYFEEQGRKLRRELFAQAAILELDGQGRIILPETLLVQAEIDPLQHEEVTIIGAGDHFEIWNTNHWKQQKNMY